MNRTDFISKLVTTTLFSLAFCANAVADSNLLLKVRGQILNLNNKTEYTPSLSTINVTAKNRSAFSAAAGMEVAASYFISENVAVEGSLSFVRSRLSRNLYVSSDGQFYQQATGSSKGSKTTYLLPVSLIAQYHFIPEDQFSPYFGLGYGYMLIKNTNMIKFSNLSGPVIQAGLDIWDNDDLGINIDIKKYWGDTKSKLKYLVDQNGSPLKAKYTIDPLVISAGVAFRM